MKPTTYRAGFQRLVAGVVSFWRCILASTGGGLFRPWGSPDHSIHREITKWNGALGTSSTSRRINNGDKAFVLLVFMEREAHNTCSNITSIGWDASRLKIDS